MGTLNEMFGFEKDRLTVIKEWIPKRCSTEKDYENSLVKHLRKHLPKARITPQFAIGRTKADIVIDGKDIVEIKKDLKSTAVRDRLIGQLTQYKEWRGKVFVVIVGEKDPDILAEVRKFAEAVDSQSFDAFFGDRKIIIVEK